MSLNTNTFVRPTGFRRLNLDMLAIRDRADQFAGIPRGTAKPLTLLAAFQEAEPYLGLPSHAFKLISWLVKQTMAIDWEEGSRPIVWPSARRQQEFLNLSAARVKVLNRALYEAGIFVIRDNPQGKRYGRRDHEGRIIEAEEVLEASLDFKPFERVEKLHPGELLELAPRLAAHIPQNFPDWNDIVDVAGSQLRHELGVSQALWGDSCRAVGRQIAAVTLAIVSTKPQEHFTRGAGGYFAAMIKRAKTGELHLDRSLWKLRRDRWSRPSDGTKTRQQARTWG